MQIKGQTPTFHSQVFQQGNADQSYFLGNKKKQISQHSNIKELLSTSCGEIVTDRPKQQINVKQEFKDAKHLLTKNKLSYLQSNIFNNSQMQIRNDQHAQTQFREIQKPCMKLKIAPPTTYIPTKGTLNKEFNTGVPCTNKTQQQSSQVFGTLDRYYTETQEKVGRPNFMAYDMNFLSHDSIRNRGLEREEQKYQQTIPSYRIMTPSNVIPNVNNKQSDAMSIRSHKSNISNKSSITQQSIDSSFHLTLHKKANSFNYRQFNNYCKHNGFELQGTDRSFILKPKEKNSNLHEVVKYLKLNQNDITVRKLEPSKQKSHHSKSMHQ